MKGMKVLSKMLTMLSLVIVCIAMLSSVAIAQVVPIVPQAVKDAAIRIDQDTKMIALKALFMDVDKTTQRWIDHMEVTRIASPSRQELHRAAELTKRFKEWGFSDAEIKTNSSNIIQGAGLQKVDGLPVYQACVEIKGSYSSRPGAKSYNGQYPKVLIEGHIDTVNPATLANLNTRQYEPIKLQPIAGTSVASTAAELAAIPLELSFDAQGKLIKNQAYTDAYKRFDTSAAAKTGGGYRIYVPGYSDAMGNTINVLYLARYAKQLDMKPVYDMWFCGTAGEEGRGNLAGMKQLYGYNQDTGKGNNALNFVANFGIDGGGNTINFLGSYRFDVRYTAPANKDDKNAPSSVNAVAQAIAEISKVRTIWDDDKSKPKVTYTVGVVKCTDASADKRPSYCSFEIDMRAPTTANLNPIRDVLKPLFQKGATTENRRVGINDDSTSGAVKMSIEWFGDRPAYVRDTSDPANLDSAIYAAWQSAVQTNTDLPANLPLGSSSLNDNIPAAVGVPTINLAIGTTAGGGGGHAFNEWGTPGSAAKEADKAHRVLMTGLIAAGYHSNNGSGEVIIEPLAQDGPTQAWPLRTTSDLY